jgi:hypothetical protein
MASGRRVDRLVGGTARGASESEMVPSCLTGRVARPAGCRWDPCRPAGRVGAGGGVTSAKFSSHPSQVTEKPAPSPCGGAAANPQSLRQRASTAIRLRRSSTISRGVRLRGLCRRKRLTSRIQQYTGTSISSPFVDTIRYPAPVPKPTISDLAKDGLPARTHVRRVCVREALDVRRETRRGWTIWPIVALSVATLLPVTRSPHTYFDAPPW